MKYYAIKVTKDEGYSEFSFYISPIIIKDDAGPMWNLVAKKEPIYLAGDKAFTELLAVSSANDSLVVSKELLFDTLSEAMQFIFKEVF